MSFEHYQQLQSTSQQNSELLGVKLPALQYGYLDVQHKLLNFTEVCAAVKAFSPSQGWVMYRDNVSQSNQIPERHDLIEAEYSQGESSLSIRLINPNQYSVSTLTMQATGATPMAYKTQTILGQKRIGEHLAIQYRLWYKQQTEGMNQGRWQAFAQQFIGFTAAQEK